MTSLADDELTLLSNAEQEKKAAEIAADKQTESDNEDDEEEEGVDSHLEYDSEVEEVEGEELTTEDIVELEKFIEEMRMDVLRQWLKYRLLEQKCQKTSFWGFSVNSTKSRKHVVVAF